SRTYTSASDRDSRRITDRNARLNAGHVLLVLTSVATVFVLVLAYWGRLSTFGLSRSAEPPARLTNLNNVSDPKELEPLLQQVFANPPDRRFAAQGLFDFILAIRKAGDSLPNVGGILRASATADAIERRSLMEYQERLRQARAHASEKGA